MRGVANEWAKARGHADIIAYAGAKGIDWSLAYLQCSADIMAQSRKVVAKRGRMTAAEHGVRATEIMPHHMPDADDSRVQRRLRDMMEATP